MPRSHAILRAAVTLAAAGLITAAPASAAHFWANASTSFRAAGPAAKAPSVTLSATGATVYAGSMSPFEAPLVIQVSSKRITRVVAAYDTDSFFYGGAINSSKLRKAKIDRKGRFSFKVTTSLVDSPNIFWNGERYPDQIVEAFKGKLDKHSATGTVRATVHFLDGSIATTGSQRFHMAHKPGRVFGGATSQSMPVAIELNSAGTRVNHLHVAWTAPATDGGAWALADFLTNFNLTGGVFDEAFTQDYPQDDGSTLSYAYHVGMKVAKRAASGTLNITVTQTDTSGTSQVLCTSPAIGWAAGS